MADIDDLIASTYGGRRQAAQQQAVSTIDDPPDNAARALDLEQATGVPAPVIHGDLENFERQTKLNMASDIVGNNPQLQNYVTSNPMAARVSNDDYGQLDTLSQALDKIGPKSILSTFLHPWLPLPFDPQAAYKGWGGPVGEWAMQRQEDVDFARKYPGTTALVMTAGGAVEIPAKAMNALAQGLAQGASAWYTQLTGDTKGVEKGEGIAQTLMDPGFMASIHPVLGELAMFAHGPQGSMAKTAFDATKPYIDAGREPPVGMSPIMDMIKGEQADLDLKNLQEALKESIASRTRDRAPELFRQFAAQHTNARIGIAPEAIERLYGDKVPNVSDGKLGWVPNLGHQVEMAKAAGLDVEMPLADFLAKMKPEVMKEIEGDLRVRADGVTVEEAKAGADEIKGGIEQGVDVGPSYEEEMKVWRAKLEEIEQQKAEVSQRLAKAVNEGGGVTKGAYKLPEVQAIIEEQKALDDAWYSHKDAEPPYRPSNNPTPTEVVRANAGLKPVIEVFHGSPHEFSAFDLGKIGTGEGAQSYGHGLYFAENKGVAEDYQAKLGPAFDKAAYDDPEVGKRLKLAEQMVKEADEEFARQDAKADAGQGDREAEYLARQNKARAYNYLEQAQNEAQEKYPGKGQLYRVRINANREHFLDWDKPLSEQSGFIKDKLKVGLDAQGEARLKELEAKNAKFLSDTEASEVVALRRQRDRGKMTGRQYHEQMAGSKGSEIDFANAHAKLGIPGIKYLDQGSRQYASLQEQITKGEKAIADLANSDHPRDINTRGAYQASVERAKTELAELEKPTSNYVLFDDKLAQITHVNDEPTEAFKAEQAAAQKSKGRYRKPKQLEFDLRQLDELDAFKQASALGMTVDNYKRMLRLIEQQRADDFAAASKRALASERQRQTDEWRTNEAAMRQEVATRINQRPDIIADKFFREGILYGEETPAKPKLSVEYLTKEQQDALPRSFQSAIGLHPDDAAGLLGYPTGDALVTDLAKLHADRMATGGRPSEYLRKLISAETEQAMQQKYGDLSKNILREAQEQALGSTTIDILHEEMLYLATKAGAQFEFTKDQIKDWVKDKFDGMVAENVDPNKFLAAAGKAGRDVETAMLKGDWAKAFQSKQKQYLAASMAKEAIAFAKEQERFEGTMKRFSKREVAGVAQEYTDFIHDIMLRLGQGVNRSIQDLADSIKRNGYADLGDFVRSKNEQYFGMVDIPVPDYMKDPNWRRPLAEMNVADFRDVKTAIDAMAKLGRDEQKVFNGVESADRAELLKQMKDQLREFPLKDFSLQKGWFDGAKGFLRTVLANSTAMETLLNRWDRGDPNGVFNRFVVYPLSRAANEKARLIREYAKPYGALGEIKDPRKLVESPIIDPLSITEDNPQGSPLQGFDRSNVQVMVHNAGNAAQWEKFARGWGADPQMLLQWLYRNSDKEMWDRAQKLGDRIFKPLYEQAQQVYHRVYGVAPEKIDLKPLQTPFGDYEGWYHPLIKDPTREVYIDADGNKVSGLTKKQMGGDVYDTTDNFHARTSNGYTKSRTNVVYPVDLSMDMVPVRLMQMIHDIAFRESVINAEKVFRDPGLRNEIAKHYGEEYRDTLMPYLRGIAGAEGIPSKAYGLGQRLSEYFRQNVISTYIGFNIFTALKHGPTALGMSMQQVGPAEFLKAVRDLYSKSEDVNMTNKEFVDANSLEVARRHRHWQDTVVGQHAQLFGDGTFREKMIEKGSWLVAQSDMLSVRPTWLAAYRNAIQEGVEHAEAVDQADAAVRKAHGSTAITNQPNLVSGGGPLHGWLTSIYGFFGTVMQRRIELAHVINDTYKLGRDGEISEAAKNFPDILSKTFTYVIWPTLVEEAVTGLTTDDRRGWGAHALSAATLGLSSSVLYLRDFVHGLTHGHDPGVGLISSPLHDIANLGRDIAKGKQALSPQHAGKLVQDTITAFGEATGRLPKEVGNVARFGIDMANHQQNPRTPMDYFRGVTRGQSKPYQVK